MYGNASVSVPSQQKNPNRVAGGLRAQGSDHYVMLGEDGSEQRIPSQKYVQALEEKLRIQDAKLAVLEKKLKSMSHDLHILANTQRATVVEINKRNSI
jgi:hypothetical protein